MGLTTGISWCDSTINPTVGCDGCELWKEDALTSHCYAAALVGRWGGKPGWPPSFGEPRLFDQRLLKAFKWPNLRGKDRPDRPWLNGLPRLIFVCDLGDAFTESLPIDWMAPWLPGMAQAPHNWLLLTKRPSRALKFSQKHPFPPNVWIGCSITTKATLKRMDYLRRIQATVRYISAEPLLGPLTGINLDGIHQVIVGGESGPGFRRMDNQWALDIRDRCVDAGAAFYYKQSASFSSGVAPYLTEPDGSRWAWHQVPGKMLAPYLYTPNQLPIL